jgi:hypothetical protein
MIPPISPAESLLVTIGLRTLITKKVERVTKGKLDRVRTLPLEVKRLGRDMVNDHLTETFYSSLNYRAMLKDLSEGVDMQQIQDMLTSFPAQYRAAATALLLISNQVIQQLQTELPTSSYQTVSGMKNLIPDDARTWKFVSILEVLDNPLLVFPLMATGALLRSQAHAVRTLYPTLSAHIDAWILDATIKAKAKLKSFELSPRAEVGVKAWMGQGPVSPGVLASSQQAVQSAKDKKVAAQSQAQAKRKSNLPQMSETAAQGTDLKAP